LKFCGLSSKWSCTPPSSSSNVILPFIFSLALALHLVTCKWIDKHYKLLCEIYTNWIVHKIHTHTSITHFTIFIFIFAPPFANQELAMMSKTTLLTLCQYQLHTYYSNFSFLEIHIDTLYLHYLKFFLIHNTSFLWDLYD
jgi:hypothetical protein